MMNGRGKSDSAIVAGKPTNKAGQPAAESVEPSAEAEGNASQQSTRRAQDRESVSQALERIRQVARQPKKERFTSLFHHISTELLEEAFLELKEDAAPGVDRLTWKDYEADLERKLGDLHDRVQRGAYRALPSRRVYIPLQPSLIARPTLRKKQSQPQHDRYFAARKRQRYQGLAIGGLAQRRSILRSNTHRMRAFLGYRSVVNHQHGIVAADEPICLDKQFCFHWRCIPDPGGNEVVQLVAFAQRKPLRHRLNALAIARTGSVPTRRAGTFVAVPCDPTDPETA